MQNCFVDSVTNLPVNYLTSSITYHLCPVKERMQILKTRFFRNIDFQTLKQILRPQILKK